MHVCVCVCVHIGASKRTGCTISQGIVCTLVMGVSFMPLLLVGVL